LVREWKRRYWLLVQRTFEFGSVLRVYERSVATNHCRKHKSQRTFTDAKVDTHI
jgi:hypothetical protein